MTIPSGSKFNLHHVSQTLELIELLIAGGIFKPSEIAIQSPYRAQNGKYRDAMAAAAKSPFWKTEGRDIWAIKLISVDSF